MKNRCPFANRKCPDNEKCRLWDWETRDCAIMTIMDGILDLNDLLKAGLLIVPKGDVHL